MVRRIRFTYLALTLSLGIAALAPRARAESPYENDVQFALQEIPKNAQKFIELKKIDWPAVAKQFTDEAKAIKTDQEHLVLLTRLLARLKDGHASVLPRDKTKDIQWPQTAPQLSGPGMFWCAVGDDIFVKNSFSGTRSAGISPGMQVLKVDGLPVHEWIDRRIVERADRSGASTSTQALFMALHWGLAAPTGTNMDLEFQDLQGKSLKKTLTCRQATYVPMGPAFFPEGTRGDSDLRYAKLKSGIGYIHFRRCPDKLPDSTDTALAALGNVPGLILDFRANGGGGFDHQAFMGRFVPKGKTLAFGATYPSVGEHPYGGPIVVIIDGNTRSAGETGAGQFKEDGRAYMIGESPSAGSSSIKTTLELPSGLFALYFSIASNKGRFNEGRGIEGVGVQPHEIVQYDPKELAQEKDTLLLRAESLLQKGFPKDEVPYKPEDFGWAP